MTPAELLAEIERLARKETFWAEDGDASLGRFVRNNLPAILSALRGVEAAREALEVVAETLVIVKSAGVHDSKLTETTKQIVQNALDRANAAHLTLAALSQEETRECPGPQPAPTTPAPSENLRVRSDNRSSPSEPSAAPPEYGPPPGYPTTPAPMTAERFNEIKADRFMTRSAYDELIVSHGALTARIADLEEENSYLKIGDNHHQEQYAELQAELATDRKQLETARRDALEEAAAYHDELAAFADMNMKVCDRYEENGAWQTWRNKRDEHRTSAVEIRALQQKDTAL